MPTQATVEIPNAAELAIFIGKLIETSTAVFNVKSNADDTYTVIFTGGY